MLKKFRVENFRNFKKSVELDLTSGDYDFNTGAIQENIVKHAIVYGYNDSGKSNLIKAIMDITAHMTQFHISPESYMPYLSIEGALPHASFEYEFEFNGIELAYHYKKNSIFDVLEESLWIDKMKIIDSKEMLLKIPGIDVSQLNLEECRGSFVKAVIQEIQKGPKTKEEVALQHFYTFVCGMLSFHSQDRSSYQGFKTGCEPLYDVILKNSTIQEFQSFLYRAGIDYELKSKQVQDKTVIVAILPNQMEVDLMSLVSKGTQSLILFYAWLTYFSSVTLVLMDEFDSYYHNDLTKFVIKEVMNTSVQSIFSSHNTSVISNDLLRPDCYYKVEDNDIFAFHKLTDKELRKAHNIERLYRSGAFKRHE